MPDPNLLPETDEQPEPVTTPQPESEPTVPETPATEPAADPEPEIDYKAKFAESTREAQILAAKLEEERRKNSQELTTKPTDSDLQAAFPEWEYMSEPEKRSARMAFNADRTAKAITQEREAEKAERRWQTDLELFVAANPDLEGKAREFQDYAQKPTHRGVALDVLKKAFLFEAPASAPTPTPKPGLLPGNGGPRGPEKPKLLSGDELKQLRQTNEKAYKEYIRTHDITQID
jgi:hypothetical protein